MGGVAFFGALEIGAVYGVVALGVFLTFRVLDFPDLTVESSFPLGGAIAAACIVSGAANAGTATALAALGGAAAGIVTAFLAVHCGILHLLAGILTMLAGYSINLRIMGRPNISLLGEKTVFTPLEELPFGLIVAKPLFLFALSFLLIALLSRMLLSESGLALRAAGGNPKMLRAQGGNPGFYAYAGLAASNALAALGGALFAQAAGFADVTSGVGTIIFGLAAVILGGALLRSRRIWLMLAACLAGSVVYRLAVALALGWDGLGLRASDLNLVTAVLVALALMAPKVRGRFFSGRGRGR